MSRIGIRIARFVPCVVLCALCFNGCREESPPLQLADLSDGESLYLTRVVVLERAKAIALVDRKLGNTLLDSLHTAWGDSALQQALAGAPTDPTRSSRVHELMGRILEAERDSLLDAARPDRLGAPLPDPPPRAVEEAKKK